MSAPEVTVGGRSPSTGLRTGAGMPRGVRGSLSVTVSQRSTLHRRLAGVSALSLFLLFLALPAHAATQRLTLSAGWNLISIAVAPEDPSARAVIDPLVIADNFEALWSYDAASRIWSRFPATTAGEPTFTTIEEGKGYWLKVKRAAVITIEGETGTATGPGDLATEWNLVGFSLEEPTPYELVVTNAAIRQIWTFDAVQRKFVGVVLNAQGTILREDFVNLEAGRGYWLFSNEAISLAPVLGTGLPADLDVPPLTSGGASGAQGADDELAPKRFARSAGDIDIGEDGFYDRTGSQRAIDFGERQTIQPISIFNQRSGVLSWHIEVVDPEATPWLRLRLFDSETNRRTLVTELSGTVTSETDVVDITVERIGLPPGQLEGAIKLTTNAVDLPEPAEAMRTIVVKMSVAKLDGDYALTAQIKTINDQPADLPDPKLAISLYQDTDGLKVVVNERATLLFSERLRLSGSFVESGTARFQVSGSYEMAADDPGNPYGVPVRRDLTLRGQRRDPLNPADAILGPLDLKGEYFETLRNVTATPILLAGTFVADRLGAAVSARDLVDGQNRTTGPIPDNGTLSPPRTIEITRNVLITELDVTVELQHGRPADLVLTLIGPDTTEVVLSDRNPAAVGRLMYDDFATPEDSLAAFNGKLSAGIYTLRIEDKQAGQTGSFSNWSLSIRGTEVHDVGGTITGVPPASPLLLTGCGVTAFATTGAGGTFSFKNLVDCVYRVTVLQPGFQQVGLDVVLNGSDIDNLDIEPPTAPLVTGSPLTLPSSSTSCCERVTAGTPICAQDGCKLVSLTTAGGAGAHFSAAEPQPQYILDATTYDVDRPPVRPPDGNFPRGEDTNAFSANVDPLTMTNETGPRAVNGSVDGPAGNLDLPARVIMNIGQPVIGTSVQGNLRLSVGVNP